MTRTPISRLLFIAMSTLLPLSAAIGANLLEAKLAAAKKASQAPTGMQVVYDDMHPFHGGMTVVVRGDGTAKLTERKRGEATPRETTGAATPQELVALTVLLADARAWEQQTPERMPVPDESRATLSITLDGESGGFWEWYNDMSDNDRLSRIRDRMVEIVRQ